MRTNTRRAYIDNICLTACATRYSVAYADDAMLDKYARPTQHTLMMFTRTRMPHAFAARCCYYTGRRSGVAVSNIRLHERANGSRA